MSVPGSVKIILQWLEFFQSLSTMCAFREGSLAQSVEQLAFNQLVVGSNPTRPTTFSRYFSSSGLLSSLVVRHYRLEYSNYRAA